MSQRSPVLTAYLAPEGFLPQLQAELRGKIGLYGRLVLTEGPPQTAHWAENIWYDAQLLPIKSIGHAVSQLTGMQRNWWPYAYHLHRRMELIREQLPHVKAKAIAFPDPAPTTPLGSFTLIDQHTLLAAGHCSSPFPNGQAKFVESKDGPPSRAYLKLYEALTRIGVYPGPGDRCLELGASPGGWTWVLARLGAHVTAYDRAPLDDRIMAMPGVTFVKGDGFSATPSRIGSLDWLVSDVICYPEKLLEFVTSWLDSGLCRNFVCTVKFQGTEHYGVAPLFAQIPKSRLMHLFHNKHELTWVHLAADRD